MPEELPYEDLWFSMIIKKHAESIANVKKPLYYYRQHEEQTYGSIINYQKQKNKFRAIRKLDTLKVFERKYLYFCNSKDDLVNSLTRIRKYLELMSKNDLGLYEILFNNLPVMLVAKLFVNKRTPFIIPFINRMVLKKTRI